MTEIYTDLKLWTWPVNCAYCTKERKKQDNLNSNSLFLGMKNTTANLENSLIDIYKAKYSTKIKSRNSDPWYIHNKVENLHLHKKYECNDF